MFKQFESFLIFNDREINLDQMNMQKSKRMIENDREHMTVKLIE